MPVPVNMNDGPRKPLQPRRVGVGLIAAPLFQPEHVLALLVAVGALHLPGESGLIALLTQVYSGCSARQIVETEPYFIREIGLSDHLSPTRANGLHAMLNAIKSHAQNLV